MRVFIDKPREERLVKAGWFKRVPVPEYKLFIAVDLTEEERFLIEHTGIGNYVFFRAPIPPSVTDPDEIKRMRAADAGLLHFRDLLGMSRPTLVGQWPDFIAADDAAAAIRAKCDELQRYLERAAGDPGGPQEYEP